MPEFLPPSASTTEYYRPVEVFVVQPPKQRYGLHMVLLLATIFSTLVVGARMEFNFQHDQPAFSLSDDAAPLFPARWVMAEPSRLVLGVPFAFTLMLILLAHEMGHYLVCRYYGVYATLPFFIPAPTLIGTLGAFIRIRSPIRSRAALFDIGIGGPLAGFAVAVTVLFLALPLSKAMPPGMAGADIQLGYPLIFRLAWYALPLAGVKAGASGLNGVNFHPTAIAAWVGMFATALNLLPGGQLDGGHIVFSLAPRAHKVISRLTILALIPMALYFWAGWLIWAILLRITGMRHPMVPEWPGVTGVRRWIGGLGLVLLILTLAPVPLGPHSGIVDLLRAWRSAR